MPNPNVDSPQWQDVCRHCYLTKCVEEYEAGTQIMSKMIVYCPIRTARRLGVEPDETAQIAERAQKRNLNRRWKFMRMMKGAADAQS